ncbi:MAG: GH36-type glycosyl hydrolase domain-containing protein [Metallibacterium sp.]
MSSCPPSPTGAALRVQLLSNGRYSVMLNAAGSGYSNWRDFAVTRWREDPVGDGWGSYLLLRDEESGKVWSAGPQPCGIEADVYTATLSDGHVGITQRHGMLTTTLDVAVASDRDVELRRVTLANHGEGPREITLTSYAELVLGPAAADAAHPAFSKMFVQTEWVEQDRILLATRRRRAPAEAEVWAAHVAVVEAHDAGTCEFETDRMRFLGRGHTLRHARAMQTGASLSNTSGCVLDPVFSLRRRVRVAPGASVRVAFWTALADSRAAVLALVQPLRAGGACAQVLAGSMAHAIAEQARLGIDAVQAERFGHLASALLYADSRLRAPAEVLERGSGGAPVLWGCDISGDRPLVLLRIASESGLARVHEVLLAQRYWQSKRLGVDVVLLNTAGSGGDPLQAALNERAQAQNACLKAELDAVPVAVFALRDSTLSDALRAGLATVARVVLDAAAGLPDPASWDRDGNSAASVPKSWKPVLTSPTAADAAVSAPPITHTPREFDNGMGGFIESGRAYAITLDGDRYTPVPWINVIANPGFGFLVSAEGGGYTWSLNSQQNPLTPWPNDPVSDTPHEVLYLRDEDSGELWSATALPIRVPAATYSVQHGKGWSRFTHAAHGIDVALLQFVPPTDPVKLSRLSLRNCSARTRHVSITGYVEWALGANGTVPAPFVATSRDAETGALCARNAWRAEFGERVAFIDLGGRQRSCTGDRLEFLGRHGAVERPAALTGGIPLSGCVGAGLDPCGALQASIVLAPGERIEIVFMLGDAASRAEAQALIGKYRTADLDAVLREVRAQWDAVLDTVQVRTPDRAMDILLNDWLLYQTLGCRLWARTAYYQASGAYGFRDQLQDVMALCVTRPDLAREHVLRATARQFIQGDVQHWWLPPSGQGIRTRISDDRIWLAYVAAHYIAVTADTAVLDENVPFLDGAAIKEGAADAFYQPGIASEQGSLYEHAARAIDSSLTLGAHGLPLIGTGDWNDGMNNVGAQGRGESVWLAWLLLATVKACAPWADARGESARAASWRAYATALRVVLESASGWDGAWYRRGYYDDGAPLGSHESQECKIDAIAQSWSLISGAADPGHAAQAMAAVEKYLVLHNDKIALLFTPPFDHTSLNPGYIKGYPPGIRENGGQYTHGATWSIFACALLGQGDRAGELFDILNPIRHSDTPDAVACYQVEPYVACADVYAVAPYIGRGGWTWYSGSAGWLYRAGLEAILGFQPQGDHLRLSPCIPKSWPRYDIVYRHRGKQGIVTPYEITVENPASVHRGVIRVELDGVEQAISARDAARIPLREDARTHRVRIVLG